MLVLRMAHRKWKEQQPSMLPGPAVPGCGLVSFNFLRPILSTSTVGTVGYLNLYLLLLLHPTILGRPMWPKYLVSDINCPTNKID